MTTNAVLLHENAAALEQAGLHRLTVSLDTLHRDRFKALTRYDELDRVLQGIDAAVPLFPGLKIDTVVIRGTNDDELSALLAYGRERSAEVRFIEYMDVGGATHWSMDRVVARADILERLSRDHGPIEPILESTSAPADRYRLADGTVFGIISSTTQPFCAECDRSRLTADGMWYLCLYARRGVDLRKALRGGASPAELRSLVESVWARRTDRGAEDRLAARDRAPLIPIETLKRDPHLEMHTRGG
jgi:cyclic pyranopterin phosphate synthase